MDAAGFAVSSENVPVPVTKYPTAHGYWRSTHPSLASSLAHNDFVIHVLVTNPTPNLETLTGMVEKTFVATYGPNGARQVQNQRKMKDKAYENAGVDQAGVWIDPKLGGSSLLRARDHDAASELMDEEVATDPDIDHPVDGVPGLADSKCFALTPESSTPGFKFECYVQYDRYVAGTYSGDDADARQRAAAQYALLAAP